MAHIYQNYLLGQLKSASSSLLHSVKSPHTGETLGEASLCEVMDLVMCLQAAKKAQQDFVATTLEERKILLEKIHEQISTNKDSIVLSETRHTGLTKIDILQFVFEPSLQLVKNQLAEIEEQKSAADSMLYSSIGLVGVLLPRVFGFRYAMEVIVKAIASGNGLMIKSSSSACYLPEQIGKILEASGCPTGLINVFNGTRESIGDAMVQHPSLKRLVFWGAPANADKIYKNAAQNQKTVQVAGGLKNAAFLLDSLNGQSEAFAFFDRIFQGGFFNPLRVDRIFILDSHAEFFWKYAQDYLAATRQKIQEAEVSHLNLYQNEKQKEAAGACLEKIREEHGKLYQADVEELDPRVVCPVFSQNLPNCSNYQQDPIPALVAIVTSVKYSHEMVRWANNSYLAGWAYVHGETDKARRFAEKIEFAEIYLNEWIHDSSSIFGLKQSFYGDRDTRAFGSFWSYRKKLTSKN